MPPPHLHKPTKENIMKKTYITPTLHIHRLSIGSLLGEASLGQGKGDGGNVAESKGATYLIDDDDDLFGSRSTSFSEAEVYSPFDL